MHLYIHFYFLKNILHNKKIRVKKPDMKDALNDQAGGVKVTCKSHTGHESGAGYSQVVFTRRH